jgi:hypothetical protein
MQIVVRDACDYDLYVLRILCEKDVSNSPHQIERETCLFHARHSIQIDIFGNLLESVVIYA